jgi:uncharacterized protein (TIGR02117 family)
MKKIFQTLKKISLYFVGFLFVYLIAALILSKITVNKNPVQKDDVTIYIQTNGVHTDIVVPVSNTLKDWSKDIKHTDTPKADNSFDYLAMGWGDKGFYLETPSWNELKPSTALKAAFWLGDTAMHTVYQKNMSESKTCKKIQISNSDYQKLVTFIENSFEKDINKQVKHINTSVHYNDYDAFYEATGSYGLTRTCNTWTNDALKACNQKACLWTATQSAIFEKY